MEQVGEHKVTQISGSCYIIIPQPIAKLIGITKGTPLAVYRNGDEIIYKKVG